MSLHVRLADPSDLAPAEEMMRGVLDRDLGGFDTRWHTDLDDLSGFYLALPRHALFVAMVDGTVVGTAAIKPCQLRTPPNPEWLARRYNRPEVCQLVRVWVDARARRQGVARELVRTAARWATERAAYETVYLHTDTSVTGAEPFWRSMPTVEVLDCRPDPSHCVHFELDLEKLEVDNPVPR